MLFSLHGTCRQGVPLIKWMSFFFVCVCHEWLLLAQRGEEKDNILRFLKANLIILVAARALHLFLCSSWAQFVLLSEIFHWGFEVENNIRCEENERFPLQSSDMEPGAWWKIRTQNCMYNISTYNLICMFHVERIGGERIYCICEVMCWRGQSPLLAFNFTVY